MRRLIPPQTSKRTIIFRGFTIIEVAIIMLNLLIAIMIFLSNFNQTVKLILLVITLIITTVLVTNVFNLRGWQFLLYFIKFNGRKKKIDPIDLSKVIKFDGEVTNVNGTLTSIIEIEGLDFAIMPEETQDQKIFQLGALYKNINKGKIVKINKKIVFDKYLSMIDAQIEKWQEQAREYIETKDNPEDDGEKDFFYLSRIELLMKIKENLQYSNEEEYIYTPGYYLVIFAYNHEELSSALGVAEKNLSQAGLNFKILRDEESEQFYRNYLFLEKDGAFATPSIKEEANKVIYNGKKYKIASIINTPMYATNAWLGNAFSIENTISVINFSKDGDRLKTFKKINKTIIELQSLWASATARPDQKLEYEIQIQGLTNLLEELKLSNEQLHNFSYYIMYEADAHKDIKSDFAAKNIVVDSLVFSQMEFFQNMLPYKYETKSHALTKKLQTTTLSGAFPFVQNTFLDEEGWYFGNGNNIVMFDQFHERKNKSKKKTRTSSNLAILGKTGGGKSYALKLILVHHLISGKKVFTLDPENEYQWIAKVFGGNIIDVGGTTGGIINPLQIFTMLKDDEEEVNSTTSEVSSHRQFLQEFFRITLPTMENQAFPFLDNILGELYHNFNITNKTKISELKNTDFPVMQDLYDLIDKKCKAEMENQFSISYNLESMIMLKNNFQNFGAGGTYSDLWNGHTTLNIDNEFTVFNFQSLFNSNNTMVANGQMLIILRFLMQEIVKNKAYIDKGIEQNIVVAIDEAHAFLSKKHPVALDFMAQMVKRIRKYGGGIIVATQNIADFIGNSEETKAKATAVLNGCQYTLIFGLQPNDTNNIIDLYKNYNGGLTRNEVEAITQAEQGEALFIADPNTRMRIKIHALPGVEPYILENSTWEDYEEDEDEELQEDLNEELQNEDSNPL